MRARRLLVGLGVSFLAVLVLDQGLELLALRDGRFLGHPIPPFDPPIFSPSQAEALARIERSLATGDPPPESLHFDAELGWCNPRGGGGDEFRYDWAGARIAREPLARPKDPARRRLALWGCSMTHGDEVGATETWAAQLGALAPAVEVANMGVSAYGLDQALLRLRRDGPDVQADEDWLVWMPAASLRVTTLYRPILRHWSLDVAFKPRFRVDEAGGLAFVPDPARELADIPRLLSDQRLLLERLGDDDPWVDRARAAYAPRGTSLLQRSGIARILLAAWEAGDRALAPHLEDPGDEARRLLVAIVGAASAQARDQGAAFRLIVIPGPDDLADARHGRRFWSGVLAEVESGAKVAVTDVTDRLLAEPAPGPYAAHGHLDARGSRIVAEELRKLLTD